MTRHRLIHSVRAWLARRGHGRARCTLASAIALAACSSATPPRSHSLLAPPAGTAPEARSAPAGTLSWEVLPVSVPPGVDQPQWVVRSVDGSLVVLEQERWIGPLGDEIRAAVTAHLVQSLGAPAQGAAAPWRVRIDVQRFESAPGREARIDAVWSVASDAATAPAPLRCRGEYAQGVGAEGYLALATGHQKSVARLADAIASALKALGAGRPATCEA